MKLFTITKRTITELHSDVPYLLRWSFWLPFGWSMKLHKIVRPDGDRCRHDHPFLMIRIVLKGGYTEVRGLDNQIYVIKPWRPWAPWRIYPISKKFSHRITELTNGPSWTLALCGRNNNIWGFYTKTGWMFWGQFVNEAWAKRVMWCDDGREIRKDVT